MKLYFKSELRRTYTSSVILSDYKNFVESIPNLYVEIISDTQIRIEWKVSKGTYLVALVDYTRAMPQNKYVIRVKDKNIMLLRLIVIEWMFMATIWGFVEPEPSIIFSIIFGSLVLLAFWDYIVVNRRHLITRLSPDSVIVT